MKNLALETGQNRLLLLSEPIGARLGRRSEDRRPQGDHADAAAAHVARRRVSTDLTLWNKKDEALVIALLVTRNLDRLRSQLLEFFPTEKISVSAAGDLIVLSGEVSDVRVPGAGRRGRAAARRQGREPDSRRRQPAGAAGGEVRRGVAQRPARAGPQRLPPGRGRPLRRRHDGAVGRRRISSSTIPGTGTAAKPPVPAPAIGGGFSLFFSGLPNFPFSAILTALESSGLAKTAGRADAGRAVGPGGEVPRRRRVPDPDVDAASAPCRSSGRSSASS